MAATIDTECGASCHMGLLWGLDLVPHSSLVPFSIFDSACIHSTNRIIRLTSFIRSLQFASAQTSEFYLLRSIYSIRLNPQLGLASRLALCCRLSVSRQRIRVVLVGELRNEPRTQWQRTFGNLLLPAPSKLQSKGYATLSLSSVLRAPSPSKLGAKTCRRAG